MTHAVKLSIASGIVLAGCMNSMLALAAEDMLDLRVGRLDLSGPGSTMAQVEYRSGVDWAGLRPQLGLFTTNKNAVHLYAGLAYPLRVTNRWSLTPSASIGYYDNGNDIDLGHDIEFYTRLDVSYRINDAVQFAVGIAHISNADLGEHNPGAEAAYLGFTFDL
ncbi:MAG: acyloxyacyl hydrolase [Gammaproteobacteria bacterium]|nr:acyloxyacyl hydrolase [Gammaproteobacteria bacterium]